MQGREREIDTLSDGRSQLRNTNPYTSKVKKMEKQH